VERPPFGSMIYWRFKRRVPCGYAFAYVSYLPSGLIRLGTYNGDRYGGTIVDPVEIEWKLHG